MARLSFSLFQAAFIDLAERFLLGCQRIFFFCKQRKTRKTPINGNANLAGWVHGIYYFHKPHTYSSNVWGSARKDGEGGS